MRSSTTYAARQRAVAGRDASNVLAAQVIAQLGVVHTERPPDARRPPPAARRELWRSRRGAPYALTRRTSSCVWKTAPQPSHSHVTRSSAASADARACAAAPPSSPAGPPRAGLPCTASAAESGELGAARFVGIVPLAASLARRRLPAVAAEPVVAGIIPSAARAGTVAVAPAVIVQSSVCARAAGGPPARSLDTSAASAECAPGSGHQRAPPTPARTPRPAALTAATRRCRARPRPRAPGPAMREERCQSTSRLPRPLARSSQHCVRPATAASSASSPR